MIYFLMLAFPAISFSQKTNDPTPSVQKDYLQKSKNQKTAAWVLLGGGTALIGLGFIIGDGKNASFGDAAEGALLAGVGLLSTIGSIPLFIASGKNKKKAMNLTANIKMEKTTNFGRESFVQGSYPAIAFKINL